MRDNNEEKMIANFLENFSKKSNNSNTSTQYQYTNINLKDVINNPTEYIIPECLDACYKLWEKNIDTFMVSNYEDDHLYVLVDNLSEENESLFKKLISQYPNNFYWSDFRHYYGIRVDKMTTHSSEKLASLTDIFHMQDTKQYIDGISFLNNYKCSGGESFINEYGYICYKENPVHSNVTLENALIASGKAGMYDPESDRIYNDIIFKNGHTRYMEYISTNNKTK